MRAPQALEFQRGCLVERRREDQRVGPFFVMGIIVELRHACSVLDPTPWMKP